MTNIIIKYKFIACFLPFFISIQLYAKTTITACGVHLAPYTIASEKGLTSGLTIEVQKEVFKRMGMTLVATDLPWKRCIAWANKGLYDGILDADRHAFRQFNFAPYPTSFNAIAVFVNEDFNGDIYTPEALKGKVVLVPRGYIGFINIAKKNGWKIHEVSSEECVLKMLRSKRYKYGLLYLANVKILSKTLGIKVKHLKPIIMVQKLGFGFNFKNKSLVAKYNKALKSMIKDGTIDGIYKKYLPFTYTKALKSTR